MPFLGAWHALEVSRTNQDTTSAETRTIKFKVQSGNTTAAEQTTFFRSSEETGNESHLEESAPTPIAAAWNKSVTLAGDPISTAFFLYWPTQGGGDTVPTQLNATTGYEHVWSGPVYSGSASYTARAFSLEDLGVPGTSDADFNRLVHNVTPSRVEISGTRGAVVSVSADLVGGGLTATAGSGTGSTWTRSRLYNNSMVHVMTNGTAGFASNTTWFGGATSPVTDSNWTTLSQLASTVTSVTSAVQEWTIRATQDLDLQRSLAPGNLTANYAAYVPKSGDWIWTNQGQQMEFDFLFNQDDTSGLVEGLRAEYEAGTRRGFEVILCHPNGLGSSPDTFFGLKVTCANMAPVSWAEESDGFGQKYVRVTYRANWDTTKNYAWHIAGVNVASNPLGE